MKGARQAKDLEYAARFVFVKPSSAQVLETRLKESGIAKQSVEEVLKSLSDELKQADTSGFYDKVVVGDDLEAAYKSLHGFIYGSIEDDEPPNGEVVSEKNEGNRDEPMEDALDN